MPEILKNIVSETMTIYSLATLNGKLFIPFFIGCIYLLLSHDKDNDRARAYLVYPSLVICFILFNPIIIHLLYKYIGIEERIARMYWPLPMAAVTAYCFVKAMTSLSGRWRRIVLAFAAVFILLVSTEFTHSGQSYGPAQNPQKMPKGTKEVCDAIYELNLHESADVVMPTELFFWVRQYRSSINIPHARVIRFWYKDGALDLDVVGKRALRNDCEYVVLNSSEPTIGNLKDYGYYERMTIEGEDTLYVIYMRTE